MRAIAWALPLLAVLASCARQPLRIASESMLPTLAPGDVVFPSPLSDSAKDVQRGMVVVYEWFEGVPFADPGSLHIFRVVAVPGDRLSLQRDTLRVNGVVVDEPYAVSERPESVRRDGWPTGSEIADAVVPRGAVFVLGDNRFNAIDSRYHGPVPLEHVRGFVAP